MKRVTFLRFTLFSIACAAVLGLLTLLALRAFTESSSIEFRRHMMLSLAAVLEHGPIAQAIQRYQQSHPEGRLFRAKVWVVSPAGQVLYSLHDEPLPIPWTDLPKPEKTHEIGLSYRFLGITPSLTVLRLGTPAPTYLIAANPRESQAHRRDFIQVFLFGSALAFSALISMLMTFYYLRKKSGEARDILLRMERGDLGARFPIKGFDEMGSLMLDFNRMASEIERLVKRLQETERARKTLFQELSHDLRTPLTSLRAAVDTLDSHYEQMPPRHRREIISVCKTEVSYFLDLLESLLFIAQMDEPHYKKATESVDVVEILECEIQNRKRLGTFPNLAWELNLPKSAPPPISGDTHLIRRLIRNAIENASRFAKTKVTASVSEKDASVCLRIRDDGIGMTEEEIEKFGKPKNRRTINPGDIAHVSLGLGSVIMSRVLELHKGSLSIRSSRSGAARLEAGTQLEIQLPIR